MVAEPAPRLDISTPTAQAPQLDTGTAIAAGTADVASALAFNLQVAESATDLTAILEELRAIRHLLAAGALSYTSCSKSGRGYP